MTLSELYAKQQQEIEKFNMLRDQTWQNLQQEQQAITAAFGSREKLPDDIRQRFDNQIDNYHREWATNTGERFQEIVQHHEQQRENISGVKHDKPEQSETEQKPKSDELTEKQAEMQKIIAQQQAIRKRQQEKKRGR